jgi:hypothetical protein
MTHLLAVWRWLKLLSGDAAENLKHLLALLRWQSFPELLQC